MTSICHPGHPVFALEGAPPDAAIVGTGVARVLQLCDALKIARCPKPETKPEVRRAMRCRTTLPSLACKRHRRSR